MTGVQTCALPILLLALGAEAVAAWEEGGGVGLDIPRQAPQAHAQPDLQRQRHVRPAGHAPGQLGPVSVPAGWLGSTGSSGLLGGHLLERPLPSPPAPPPPGQLAEQPRDPTCRPGPRAYPLAGGRHGRPKGGRGRLGAPRAEGAAFTSWSPKGWGSGPGAVEARAHGSTSQPPPAPRPQPPLCPLDAALLVKEARGHSSTLLKRSATCPGNVAPVGCWEHWCQAHPGVFAGSPAPLGRPQAPSTPGRIPAAQGLARMRGGPEPYRELRGQPCTSSLPLCHP